jgi:hypothetical protein
MLQEVHGRPAVVVLTELSVGIWSPVGRFDSAVRSRQLRERAVWDVIDMKL